MLELNLGVNLHLNVRVDLELLKSRLALNSVTTVNMLLKPFVMMNNLEGRRTNVFYCLYLIKRTVGWPVKAAGKVLDFKTAVVGRVVALQFNQNFLVSVKAIKTFSQPSLRNCPVKGFWGGVKFKHVSLVAFMKLENNLCDVCQVLVPNDGPKHHIWGVVLVFKSYWIFDSPGYPKV